MLLFIVVAFLCIRLPLVLRQAGGQDEGYYAIPGLTISRTGIPQLPHVPQRDKQSCFYRADEAFFAEPPLFFYWQAVWFRLLPATYGTARLASLVAGIGALLMLYALGWRLYGDVRVGLLAAGLFSLSRAVMFPAMTARPDMLCTMIGLSVILTMIIGRTSRHPRQLLLTGILLGLGGLTHPFAIVFAVQAGLWMIWTGETWRQGLLRGALLTVTAIATFGFWLPLILSFPEQFAAQFGNNILAPAGPGLLMRLIWPWPSLAHHAVLLRNFVGPMQMALMIAGLLGATCLDLGRLRNRMNGHPIEPVGPENGPVIVVLLTWSAVYLLAVLAGEHPTQGFWSYPGALMFLCLGRCIAFMADGRWEIGPVGGRATSTEAGTVNSSVRRGRGVVLAVVTLLLMLPGAGLRTWAAHLKNWNNVHYRSPEFAQRLISELPVDATYAVDRGFVLDFLAAGRRTIVAEVTPFYFNTRKADYDFLILSHYGLEAEWDRQLGGRLIGSAGDRGDSFACYAAIYARDPDAVLPPIENTTLVQPVPDLVP